MWEEARHGSFTSNRTGGERPWRTDAPSSAPKQAPPASRAHTAERPLWSGVQDHAEEGTHAESETRAAVDIGLCSPFG